MEKPLFKSELRQRSTARVAGDPEFQYISDDLELVKKRIATNRLSLNIDKRRAEIDEEKARKEKRTADRAARTVIEPKRFSLTLDNVTKPELQLVTNDKKKDPAAEEKAAATIDDAEEDGEAENTKPVVDAVRAEALKIVADLVELSHGNGAKSPSTARNK